MTGFDRPVSLTCIQETREVEFPKVGDIDIKPADVEMAVAAHEVGAPSVPGEPLGAPLPVIVMPMLEGTIIPVVQVHEPAGMTIVSPLTATCVGPLMTAFTSLRLQEAAVKVPWECAGGVSAKQKANIMMAIASFRMTLNLSYKRRYPTRSVFKGFCLYLLALATDDRSLQSIGLNSGNHSSIIAPKRRQNPLYCGTVLEQLLFQYSRAVKVLFLALGLGLWHLDPHGE